MVLQSTGVWKYPKNLLIIDNVLSLVLSFRQAKHNCLHKKVVASISDLIYGDHFWGLGAGFINYHLYKISTPPIL